MEEVKQRTIQQNKALHKMFELLADELNTQGLEMKVVLKPEYELWWNKESVKNHLWKPLMHAMYDKWSTKELTTKELDKVFEQLAKILGEHHKIELHFPSVEEMEENLISLEKIK